MEPDAREPLVGATVVDGAGAAGDPSAGVDAEGVGGTP
jgi:hypothetical protein